MPIRFISVATWQRPIFTPSAFKRSRSIRLPANGKSRCSSSIRRMMARSAAGTARGKQ
jgi:hypothetical protein